MQLWRQILKEFGLQKCRNGTLEVHLNNNRKTRKTLHPTNHYYPTLEVDGFWTYISKKQEKHWLIYTCDRETKEIVAYLRIVCKNVKIMTLQTFSQIEKLLPTSQFLRIHKSFIVSHDKIESVERNVVKIGEQRISVDKNHQEEFYRKLNAV